MSKSILSHIEPFKAISQKYCLTVFIHATSVEQITNYLSKQRKDAGNIKNAFKSKLLKQVLTTMMTHVDESQEVGNLVIFGSSDTVAHFILPYNVDVPRYYCDDKFRVDLIKERIAPSPKLGVVVIQSNKATFYHYMPSGTYVVHKINKNSDQTFWSDIKKAIGTYFDSYKHIFSRVLLGNATALKHFTDATYITLETDKKISEMKGKLTEMFLSEKFKKPLAHLEEIFLNLNAPKVVYGLRDVAQALEYQQLETLYTTKTLSQTIEQGNCNVIKIPKKLQTVYNKLESFGGVVGWKYY